MLLNSTIKRKRVFKQTNNKTIMKKSELIARYDHFGKDINEIALEQFHLALKEQENSFTKKPEWSTIDGDTECLSFSIDGCDYYHYSSMWNVGWQGDKDCDCFCFNIVTMTEKEREEMAKIFTQQNDYSENIEANCSEEGGY